MNDFHENPELIEFNKLLTDARDNLITAKLNFENWEALWPTKDTVRILNAFNGFFLPTRNAILDIFIIKAYNVLNPYDKNAPSFHRLLKLAAQSPAISPQLDKRSISKRLKQQRQVIKRLKTLRDRRAAHWDTQNQPDKLFLGESRKLLADLEAIFIEIYEAHTGNGLILDLKSMRANDVIDSLDKYLKLRSLLFDIFKDYGLYQVEALHQQIPPEAMKPVFDLLHTYDY